LGGKATTPDPMARLVYRVTPVPETMQDFIFDFGALEHDTELLYVRAMIQGQFGDWDGKKKQLVADLMQTSQIFVREYEQDSSAVSLRDVKRVLNLIQWFLESFPAKKQNAKIEPDVRATVLALAHAYCYRLSASGARQSYWIRLQYRIKESARDAEKSGFGELQVPGQLQAVVERAQRNFTSKLSVESGIAMKQALMETLFAAIICSLNRFLVSSWGSQEPPKP
jgi:hypothetical protein